MRLWHTDLIPYLPRLQLLGQHRECCALRGNGWGRKHSTIDYIYNYAFCLLIEFHKKVMAEMKFRGYNVNPKWDDESYRGKNHDRIPEWEWIPIKPREKSYAEHDNLYLESCIKNILKKMNKAIEEGKLEKYPAAERARFFDGIRFFQQTYRLDPKIKIE